MDENQRIKENIKNLTFTQKIEHIWFYYKWFIVIGILLILSVAVCLSQCTSKKDPDAMIMYAGPETVSTHYYEYVDAALSEIMNEDYNGDGYKTVDMIEIALLTSDSEHADNAAMQSITKQETNLERFYIEKNTGASVIYLIDENIYPSMKDSLLTLEQALGYTPDAAYDEYGIKLSQLECYKNTDIKYLPKNAILCIRKQREFSMIKGNDSDEYFENNLKYLNDLISWTKSEKE